jgi:DNA-binding HxlR family transcriptional regulator
MDTTEIVAAANARCEEMSEEQDLLVRDVLGRVADKWPLWVMNVLGEGGTLRFTRVLERVDGISQKVLTQTLRQLERDGLVTRTMYMQVPPRVEYSLTPMGRELLAVVAPLWLWVADRVDAFEAARGDFDARRTETGTVV